MENIQNLPCNCCKNRQLRSKASSAYDSSVSFERSECVGQSCLWVCFSLAGMEPQDMISWRNNTNNLPDFINNYILQRDNVRIDENPLKPGRGGLSKLAHKCPCNFLFHLHWLYFVCITPLSKGNTPMNISTTKQTLQLCWYVNVGQRCQENEKSDNER